MVHVALGGLRPQRVDLLGHLDHVQRGDTEDLGLAALEQRAAVRPRHHGHLGAQRADVGDAAPVDTEVVGQDALSDKLFGQRTERSADFLLPAGVLLGQSLEHLGLDLVGAVVALVLTRDGQRLGQLVGGHRGHRVVHVVAVIGEDGVVAGRLGRAIGQLLLRGTQRRDERLGGLEAFGHNGFRGRLGTARDQFDDVLGGLGLDHHDGHVIVFEHAAGDHHVEHGPLELLDGREGDPGSARIFSIRDQRDAHRADGSGERKACKLGGRRCRVDGHHVVQIVGIQAHHRDDNLDLVTQTIDKRRAQRPVGQPAGQDRVGGRAALAAEERAGDAPRGVHALLDVDRQREEVEVVLRVLAGGGRRQQHGLVVEVGDDGAGGLLGKPAGLEADGAGAEAPVVDYGGGFVHAVFNFDYRHGRPYGLSGFIVQLFRVVTASEPPA